MIGLRVNKLTAMLPSSEHTMLYSLYQQQLHSSLAQSQIKSRKQATLPSKQVMSTIALAAQNCTSHYIRYWLLQDWIADYSCLGLHQHIIQVGKLGADKTNATWEEGTRLPGCQSTCTTVTHSRFTQQAHVNFFFWGGDRERTLLVSEHQFTFWGKMTT